MTNELNTLLLNEVDVESKGKELEALSLNDRDKQIKLINETLNVQEGDELVLFSIKTKLGKSEIHKEIEKLINEGK